jgi:hypothetical protein
MTTTFKRTIEDFTCEKCGAQVKGNGYTNHCPQCLWSKHVDVHPGDREATCEGLMEPVRVVAKKDAYILTHRCVKCGYEKNNESAKEDSIDALIEIART